MSRHEGIALPPQFTATGNMRLGDYLSLLGAFRLAATELPSLTLRLPPNEPAAIVGADLGALVDALVEATMPPIWSPWNADSGHYGHSSAHPMAKWKDGHPRLHQMTDVVSFAAKLTDGRTEAPTEDDKLAMIRAARATGPEAWLPWMDVAVPLSSDGVLKHPLTGSGGNFGRHDIGRDYMDALCDVTETPGMGLAAQLTALLGGAAHCGAARPGRIWWNGTDVLPMQIVLATIGLLWFAVPVSARLRAGGSVVPATGVNPITTVGRWTEGRYPDRSWMAPLWDAPMTAAELADALAAPSHQGWSGHLRYTISTVSGLPMHRVERLCGSRTSMLNDMYLAGTLSP